MNKDIKQKIEEIVNRNIAALCGDIGLCESIDEELKLFEKYKEYLNRELTTLLQQEREKAVREFVGTIRLNGYSIENRFESPPENKMSVFVMLELMITAMYNYFGKHLAKESEKR